MTTAEKILSGVEARLCSLRVTPSDDGYDIDTVKAAISRATDTVLAASGFDEVPNELIGAVSDIAAADCAEWMLSSASSSGDLASKSDGHYSVKYKDGTSSTERIFTLTKAMRENGISAMNAFRKLRW